MKNTDLSITIIMTCYNRREKTLACLTSIDDPSLDLRYIVTDDASTDGTADAVRSFASSHGRSLSLIEGSGSLFWAGGMRLGMEMYLDPVSGFSPSDYVVLVNDDVVFEPGALAYMIDYSRAHADAVVAGVTSKSSGGISYGGSVSIKGRPKFTKIPLSQSSSTPCDVFNCNCTLFPDAVFHKLGAFDPYYTHAMADYDYALALKRLGIPAFQTDRPIGSCDDNPTAGTWQDTSLPRRERIRLKKSPKGLPADEYWHFLRKNFGLMPALWHSFTPYLRILLKR
ncbi:MAG: glycosyltransferase family 2 protein [Lachnospiraceae bacterium]|nr:glycosyltransferase family 2 protein [Lachnospiraceae bacterium]